ncbi:MAG: hypothetical protein IJM30_09490 [Thermoguttaceae bacterium]|nr:hypothetical protein [Thermoguttaceae bacterium]
MKGRLYVAITALLSVASVALGFWFKGALDKKSLAAKRSEQRRASAEARLDSLGFVEIPNDPESASFRYQDVPRDKGTLAMDYGTEFDFDPVDDSDEEIRSLKELICEERYDEVIERIENVLAQTDFFSEEEIRRNVYRKRLLLLATAAELKGDREKALSVYESVYSQDSDLRTFAVCRTGGAIGIASARFDAICETAARRAGDFPVDELIKDYVKFSAESVDGNPMEPILREARYRDVYRFLDQCLRLVDPKFHYPARSEEGSSVERAIERNIAARERFKDFVESEYELYMSDPSLSENDKALYERSIVFLRKLSNVP